MMIIKELYVTTTKNRPAKVQRLTSRRPQIKNIRIKEGNNPAPPSPQQGVMVPMMVTQ